ncbi:hypothetical protein IC617_00585 [Neiella sp. HB171785]|uniref:DUF2178 domain-containing protein n=1 Tax=Neiella litorisoli TaxID=2771431 RepID=A0A8J6QTE9_9GAMM|nr:hypothetical protein [Neiella litorisoli]MBD1387913.1 hypothetical protein [Neiella litorisoli]
MSFQEKSAWVMLVALSCSVIFYVVSLFNLTINSGALPSPSAPALLGLAIVTVVIAIAGHIIAAVLNPKEANAPADERERLIVQKAGHLSSHVLAVGVVLALLSFLLIQDGQILFYGCFASLVLSHLAEYALHIVFNRRSLN